jgi:hypothetical protein
MDRHDLQDMLGFRKYCQAKRFVHLQVLGYHWISRISTIAFSSILAFYLLDSPILTQ